MYPAFVYFSECTLTFPWSQQPNSLSWTYTIVSHCCCSHIYSCQSHSHHRFSNTIVKVISLKYNLITPLCKIYHLLPFVLRIMTTILIVIYKATLSPTSSPLNSPSVTTFQLAFLQVLKYTLPLTTRGPWGAFSQPGTLSHFIIYLFNYWFSFRAQENHYFFMPIYCGI